MNNLLRKKTSEITKRKKGFTLVELIIVIAIIAILAVMAIPKFSAIRKDAKVSNDVAAAKNIQTQVALAVAKGTINVPVADKTPITADIWNKLDGKVGTDGKSEVTGEVFTYSVDPNEDIKVNVGDNELYPDNEGTGKKGHSKAAKSTTTP